MSGPVLQSVFFAVIDHSEGGDGTKVSIVSLLVHLMSEIELSLEALSEPPPFPQHRAAMGMRQCRRNECHETVHGFPPPRPPGWS